MPRICAPCTVFSAQGRARFKPQAINTAHSARSEGSSDLTPAANRAESRPARPDSSFSAPSLSKPRDPAPGVGGTMQPSPLLKAPPAAEHLDLSRIAQDLQIRKVQVESVVQLLDEGNTVPFITRYRKERTGGLDEEVIRVIQDRVQAAAAARRAQADHPQEHREPGQADRRAAHRHPRGRDPQAARRPVPAVQAEEAHAWPPTARERGLEPLAAGGLEPRPGRGQPRRGRCPRWSTPRRS